MTSGYNSTTAQDLDSPERYGELQDTIRSKKALYQWYRDIYRQYQECLARCPSEGKAIELGSGGGFAKEVIPELITTDYLDYQGVDMVLDATKMSLADEEVRGIFMLSVLHHIPDVESFFNEALRVLKPGGRIFIADQHAGWISRLVLKYAHHEDFDDKTEEWKFPSEGPLSSANGALAWIVFQRDIEKFQRLFPNLKVIRYQPHSPLIYWLAGGLKKWSLVPGWAYRLVNRCDQLLVTLIPNLGSFVYVELEKTN